VRAKTVTAEAEGRPVGRMPRARDVGADPGVGPGVLDADPWCEVEALARGWMDGWNAKKLLQQRYLPYK
jgi:hypothetical protein